MAYGLKACNCHPLSQGYATLPQKEKNYTQMTIQYRHHKI